MITSNSSSARGSRQSSFSSLLNLSMSLADKFPNLSTSASTSATSSFSLFSQSLSVYSLVLRLPSKVHGCGNPFTSIRFISLTISISIRNSLFSSFNLLFMSCRKSYSSLMLSPLYWSFVVDITNYLPFLIDFI